MSGKNGTQIERYKNLLSFLDEHFKEDINIKIIEEVSNYSYRNINRIFEAIHQETIGKYVKRLRLEKAAQYLKYSSGSVSDIAYEVGFEERAAFSKAFKKRYNCSPSAFRESTQTQLENYHQSEFSIGDNERMRLEFEIEFLPDFQFVFQEYRGDYYNVSAIEIAWNQFFEFSEKMDLIREDSIFMAEVMDDNEISDDINLRYNLALILTRPVHFKPEGLTRIKTHKKQKYAKFIHKGSHLSCIDFYQKIYAFWIEDVGLELADLPTLEFYPNHDKQTPEENLITEIMIPVM